MYLSYHSPVVFNYLLFYRCRYVKLQMNSNNATLNYTIINILFLLALILVLRFIFTFTKRCQQNTKRTKNKTNSTPKIFSQSITPIQYWTLFNDIWWHVCNKTRTEISFNWLICRFVWCECFLARALRCHIVKSSCVDVEKIECKR